MATFNPSLFESYDDYMSIMDSLAQANTPAQAPRPKAVLFGDSMSEYVGYNADGTPNTKYGNSIADVIGNNLGINVTNLATGGETSNEALAGGSKFGAFADYIAQNKPEYAIIRYGAADAIKNKDPNVTLQSIQQMVDIARANGVTPIIVGVSELYGAQNSKTGNIAGYIDPGAEQRANAINAGLAQLASRNGLAFTDVRSAVSAGQGDLLDGVHTNADFGKKMADAISESIVDQAAIQGINVPQLPPNVDALSNEEKGRLYNQLIDQGYSDAQIRTAAKSESDQDWNALKQIAASVKNTTPAAIERRVALEVAPPAPEVEQPPAPKVEQRFEQDEEVMSQPQPVKQEAALEAAPAREQSATGVSQSIADRLMAMPRNEFETVGFQEGGKDYSMDPNGLISVRDVGAKPNDQVQVFDQSGNFLASHAVEQRSDFVQAINQAARVGIPAVIGAAILGPAGTGLLNAPAAAAVGSGGSTLLQGGSVEDALKAAALAGLGAYGTQQVTGLLNNAAYDLSFAAADAAQQANMGLSANQIAQNLSTYVDPTLASSLANTAANQAFALADATQQALQGLNANQITQVLQASGVDATTAANMAGLAVDSVANPVIDASGKVVPPTINASDIVPDLKFQPQTRNPVQISTLPDSVTVTGQGVTGDLLNIPATSVGGLLSAANLPTLADIAQAATQQVQVAGQNQAAQTTAPEAVGGALAAVTPQAPTQQVQVPGQAAANNVDPDTASAVLSNLLGQPVTVQGGTQSVDVTGRPVGQTITPEVAASLLSAAAGQQVVVQAPTTPPAPPIGQQVQVTGQGQQNLDADTASTMLSSLLGQPVAVQGSTQSVDVTGQTVQQTVAPETAAALLSAAVGQQVTVTGTNIPPAPPAVPETAGGLLSSLVTPPPTQIVPVTGQTVQPPSTTPTTVGSVVSALAPTQTVPVEDRSVKAQTTAPVIPVTPAEQVVVSGNRVVPVSEAVIPAGATGAAAGVTAPKTTTTTDQSLFKPSDVLKLIGLLGGAGAGSALAGAGTGTGVGVPPSDTMIGTTTPQFGSDYYAAIQRYYNTYMPQTPRNVAGPLQQWYENKFGA